MPALGRQPLGTAGRNQGSLNCRETSQTCNWGRLSLAFGWHTPQIPWVHDPWYFLRSGATVPALNMALDEALLEAVGRLGRPVFRSYAWATPTATFGYSQSFREIAALTLLRPLIRRPTGGGLVPHGEDWTYSIVVPPGHAWYALRAEASYQRVHQWLQESLQWLGVATELAPCCDPAGPGQCFVGAEPHDLLFGGRKIAGAAQRRNRRGLLIQGSLQPPPPGLNRAAWETAVLAAATESEGVEWDTLVLPADVVARADVLAAAKYQASDYNEKR
jgi:hypothetical protein